MSLIVGTLIAALAFNFEMLMFARVLQAVGMGLLLPLIFNTVLVIYPLEKRGGGRRWDWSLWLSWSHQRLDRL